MGSDRGSGRRLRVRWATATLAAFAALLWVVEPGAAGAGSGEGGSGHTAAMSTEGQMAADAMGLERKFVQLWNDKQWDELGTTYYADDALLVPPNHEPIRGRAAIIEYFKASRDAFGDIEGGTETFRATASGDLVSLVGQYSAHSGKARITAHELYARQPDGALRCIVDMFGFRDPLG